MLTYAVSQRTVSENIRKQTHLLTKSDAFLVLSVNDQVVNENDQPNKTLHDREYAISIEGAICSETKIPIIMFDYCPVTVKRSGNIMVIYYDTYIERIEVSSHV